MNEPWNDPHSIWKTQSAFFSWLRGSLRRIWMRYPVSTRFKNSMCRPNTGGGRARFVGDCSRCSEVFAKSHLEVDHIIPAGTISGWDNAGAFLERLLTVTPNMRLVCKRCHKIITTQENYSMTEEEAVIHGKVVEFSKLKPNVQADRLRHLGLDLTGITNAKARRRAFHEHLSTRPNQP